MEKDDDDDADHDAVVAEGICIKTVSSHKEHFSEVRCLACLTDSLEMRAFVRLWD